ncbi:MAG: DsrE family protein [Bacteroidetes bacterium]|nr:DsrE family protein [Bacteroidota bacterium]
MKKKLLFLLAIMLIAGSYSSLQAQSKKKSEKHEHKEIKKHKIVMQLTSSDALVHKGLIKQLNNLKKGWGDTVLLEVVCHGPGIEFLMSEKTTFKTEIYELKEKGVDFVACENTLREKQISKEQILPDLRFVLMGIGEIVLKQEAGWTYIKAGN